MMWRSLHDAWWRLATQHHPRSFSDALVCRVLHAGSWLYGAVTAARNTAYDRGWLRSVTLPCPVISVGNLTVGGTGKTACVELIVRKLTAMGTRVAVLSRGYGGSRRDYWLRWERGQLIINGEAQRADGLPPHQTVWCGGVADEPQLLARRLDGVPILVGPRRDRTGALACRQFACEVLVLDDGFQHRRLARDCEIVLVSARMPLGGWAMLPRGPMREPLASLKRAEVIIVTKADDALELLGALRERLHALNPRALLMTATHKPVQIDDVLTNTTHPPSHLNGKRVGLLSSIGDPEGFETSVRRLHATIVWHRTFPDHHRYGAADWDDITRRAADDQPEALVTTEKDWVRLQPWVRGRAPAVSLWVLQVRMAIVDGEQELDARLARVYAR